MRIFRAVTPTCLLWILVALAPSPASAQAGDKAALVPVTVENFTRAETDVYFRKFVDVNGLGRFRHGRQPASVDSQDVIRMNLDTFYSSAVFDLDAGSVMITLPNGSGRFMSLLPINEDHYAFPVTYAPGKFTFTRAMVGTRYLCVILRTFVDPDNPKDVAAARSLQDQVQVQQASTGRFEVPAWDPVPLGKARDALLQLASMGGELGPRFGRKNEVDPIAHLLGTAAGWGGNPRVAAVYEMEYPAANDGKTVHRLTVKDVPVDGFWSVSVYNAKGYFEKNDLGAYAFNNVTARRSTDGSVTLQFGGCGPGTPNCIPVSPGWNYVARMYRPRKAILDGTWKFPKPVPVK